MANIQFVEKEPWRNNDRFTGDCDMYPTYMVKDGVEYYMFNRRSIETKYEAEEREIRKKQLLDNDGMFFRLYGYKDSPLEYLSAVIERRHSFTKFKEIDWSNDGKFCDFHGNVKEVSAAFYYRIYDKEIANSIEKIVNLIHKKKYNEALIALNEYNTMENITGSLDDKIQSASAKADLQGASTKAKENTPEPEINH